MSAYEKRFKAGDFTSGKMGEIFKSCFMESETVIINHKVFGDCYLVPEQDIKRITNFVLGSFLGLIVQRVQGDRMIPVDVEGEDSIPKLQFLENDSHASFATKCLLEDVEGVATEFDYLTVLEKLVDLLYISESE